jgi:hypothetical protein
MDEVEPPKRRRPPYRSRSRCPVCDVGYLSEVATEKAVADGPATLPAWSRDRTKLAFDMRRNDGVELRVVPVAELLRSAGLAGSHPATNDAGGREKPGTGSPLQPSATVATSVVAVLLRFERENQRREARGTAEISPGDGRRFRRAEPAAGSPRLPRILPAADQLPPSNRSASRSPSSGLDHNRTGG